jgi:hypothetical protein
MIQGDRFGHLYGGRDRHFCVHLVSLRAVEPMRLRDVSAAKPSMMDHFTHPAGGTGLNV